MSKQETQEPSDARPKGEGQEKSDHKLKLIWSALATFGIPFIAIWGMCEIIDHLNDPWFRHYAVPTTIIWCGGVAFFILKWAFKKHWALSLIASIFVMASVCLAIVELYSGGTMPTPPIPDRFKNAITATAICVCILSVLWYRAITSPSARPGTAKAGVLAGAAIPVEPVPPQNPVEDSSLAFSVRATTTYRATPNRSRMMIVSGVPGSLVARPVFAYFLLECTNQGAKPVMLDSYSVEMLCTSGEWRTMPSLGYPDNGILVAKTEIFKGNITKLNDPSIESAARNKNIQPGETIRGWVFLSGPREYGDDSYRIRFLSTDGRTCLSPINITEGTGLDTSMQSGYGTVVQFGVDFSSVPFQIRFFNPKTRRIEENYSIFKDQIPLPEIKTTGVWMGTNITILHPKDGDLPPTDLGYFKIRLINGNGYIAAQITDGVNKAWVSDNQLIDIPTGWDWNQDEKSVEFVNEKRQVVFQMTSAVSVNGAPVVSVNGLFITSQNTLALIDGDILSGPNTLSYFGTIKPIFKYPSEEHPGERVVYPPANPGSGPNAPQGPPSPTTQK